MKKTITLLCILCLSMAKGQSMQGPFNEEYVVNAEHSPCLTNAQREAIFQKLQTSQQQLVEQGILPNPETNRGIITHPLFQWPMVKNPVAPYTEVWGISNYVDHNLNFPNQIQDWNCGTKSYDTSGGYNHQGVDIFLWPFSWYQFQNNQAWVIAAAPGTIIFKDDGNFDMNCAMGNADWNAVYVQHADGSVAWYGHMKSGSLTSKSVGQTVITGEFLGVVGSSGSSTGPHLHFEVHNAASQLVDTFSGPCNTWTSATETWWASQKAYFEPKINAVFTHSGLPVFNTCPQTEDTKFKDSFLSTDVVYGVVYLTDQTIGSVGTFTLKRPDGTTAFTGNTTASTQFNASYWWWSFNPSTFNQYGTWTISYTYSGETVTHSFLYGSDLGIDDISEIPGLNFYPNPANDRITFSKNISLLEVFNIDGKKLNVIYGENSADISTLPNGVFILKGKDVEGRDFIRKLIK